MGVVRPSAALREIKSLTVGGKQVTQSVFWQLVNEPIIDPETAELQGVP
jgi:hypothetical protein